MIQYEHFFENILNPIFWLFILVYLIWYIKSSYIKFNTNRKYLIYMIILSSVHIIIFFYLGFIFGFSKSPYNHDILSILKNIIIKILPIVGIEVLRSVLATKNSKNKILLVSITILFILIEINYTVLFNLFSNKEDLFKYICSTILPLIATNILYTYLTLKGSYSLVLIYRLYKELVVLLLPIFPNIDWFTIGSLCILSPTLVYLLFKYKFIKEKKDIRQKKKNFFEKISYAITLIFLISLICFMLGLFQYEPISILSNSMFPSFERGDVVIFKKLNDDELKKITENTIIIYSVGNQNIAHRVINIIEKNNTTLYQTKGDSNNVSDTNLVTINQIKGVYTFHLKYIGFPSIWLYDYFHKENSKI